MADRYDAVISAWRWLMLQNIAALLAAATTIVGLALAGWEWWALCGFAFCLAIRTEVTETKRRPHG